jgi:ABC-type branched-subunit amino acid transport system substrate-binding protein
MHAPSRSALAVLGVALALVAGGCAPSRSSPSQPIGALYPRSGTQGAGGSEEERGVRLAVEWANDHGGVHGRRLRLVAADAPRAEAVPGALATVRAQGASVVIGSHGSTISAAAAAESSRTGMSFFETGAVGEVGPEVAGGSSFFRLAPMGANLGKAAIAFVHDQLAARLPAHGALRYAVAHVDDPYGRAVGAGAADEVARGGGLLVASVGYDAHAPDYGPVVARIAAAHPDVLFVAAYLDDGVALRRATLDAGIPLQASIGTSSSYCMPAFGDRLGDGAVGLFASDKPDAPDVRPDALGPEGRRTLGWVTERYQARYHEPMSAPALSGFANAYAVLVHVLPAARSMSAPDIATAALGVKLDEGALANGGGLDLAPPGSAEPGANRRATSVIWEWVAPRTRAVVWPPAFATHPIVALPIHR